MEATSGRRLPHGGVRLPDTHYCHGLLDVLAERLLDFQYYWESTARPFDWKFTRRDLKELLGKFDQSEAVQSAIA